MVHAARLMRAIRRELPQPAAIRTLSLLDEFGPLGVTALAAADRCSQPTMSGTVAQLVAEGWVDKRPDPADARASVVSLTAAGRAELARIRVANGRLVADRVHTTHTVDELATAVAVLRDVVNQDRLEGNP